MSLFFKMWDAYPWQFVKNPLFVDKNGKPDPSNQCAIRFTYMLFYISERNLNMEFVSTYKGVKLKGYALRAKEMADWVTRYFGTPVELKGQPGMTTGIVFLENFQGVNDVNQRFNHIDLWNGHAHRTGSYDHNFNVAFSTAKKIKFWEVK